jgi:hypothetical protein
MGELLDLLSKRSRRSLLRFVDGDGRERTVRDLSHLCDLIRAGRIDYDTLVWDALAEQWVKAHDHEFFRGLEEAAAPPISP